MKHILILAVIFTCNYSLSAQNCAYDTNGEYLLQPHVISDCGEICFSEDTVLLNDILTSFGNGATCAGTPQFCPLEYMFIIERPDGHSYETSWGPDSTIQMLFNYLGTWNIRRCARRSSDKEGLCETPFLSVHVVYELIQLQGDIYLCNSKNGTYSILNPDLNTTYRWTFPTNTQPSAYTGVGPVNVQFSDYGSHVITLRGEKQGRTFSRSFIIHAENPRINIGPDRNVCALDSLEICLVQTPSMPGRLEWSNGETGTCTSLFLNSGEHTLGVTFESENGCISSDETLLRADTCAKIGDCMWFDEGANGNARNGIQDSDEDGVMGVDVFLYNRFGGLLQHTKTDGNGYYSFCTQPGD